MMFASRNAVEILPGGTAARLTLTRGQVCYVDVADLPILSQYRWAADRCGPEFYAVSYLWRSNRSHRLYMHRLLMGAGTSEEIDHINANGLDNRRENLRLATRSQNNANQRLTRRNASGFRGVSWDRTRHKWAAHICFQKKHMALGRHDTAEDAARAYNAKARELFGEYARLNALPGEEATWH